LPSTMELTLPYDYACPTFPYPPPVNPYQQPIEGAGPLRYLAVIDGEHYPPVIEAALNEVISAGNEIVGAVLAGGSEKLPEEGLDVLADIRVRSGDDARTTLHEAIADLHPEAVLDLSDEPVLDYRRRHALAAVALYNEVPYEGPDFAFRPPDRSAQPNRPSVAVIATGKRTGKTAVAGFAARALTEAGIRSVIVAMGRGGPPRPEVIRGDQLSLTPQDLIELADQGRHAASDYVEDAMLARVPTVGCRRCGGGLAGAVQTSNVAEGVAIADSIPADITILEGSGAAIPPARADATVLIVPASIPDEDLVGYLGPFRLLLADFAIVTMCENPFGSSSRISEIVSQIQDAWRPALGDGDSGAEIPTTRTVFRPNPVNSVKGRTAFVATTAPEEARNAIVAHLEDEHGCKVVGISHSLSKRRSLTEELNAKARSADVLLCEIKAAGVDVATRWALEEGLEVTYMDNVPQGIEGDDPELTIKRAADLARSRFEEHSS
jgi:cyclic 2,3-diphosphoglycerate synthase